MLLYLIQLILDSNFWGFIELMSFNLYEFQMVSDILGHPEITIDYFGR